MSIDRFITIEKRNGSEVYIDGQDIAAILELDQGNKDSLAIFYTLQDGEVIRLNRSEWAHDLDYVREMLEQSGKVVTSFPLYEYNGTKAGQAIISPEQVEAVVVYKTHDNDTTVCVEVYIDGYGQLQSFTVPVEETKKFIEDVYAVKPGLVAMKNRGYPQKQNMLNDIKDTVFIDSHAIRSIQPNAFDMSVTFKSGLKLFGLCPDIDSEIEKKSSMYFNKLVKRLRGNKTHQELSTALGGDLFKVLSPRLEKKRKIYNKRLREEFTEAVVIGASQALERVQNTRNIYYLDIDRATSFVFFPSGTGKESVVRVLFEQGTSEKKPPFPETTPLYFETDEKAKAEVARLTKLKQQRKPA